VSYSQFSFSKYFGIAATILNTTAMIALWILGVAISAVRGEIIYTHITDKEGNLLDSPLRATSTCFSLTWIGAADSDRNSTSCADYYPQNICNPPFIATSGNNAGSGPNMTEVVEYCRDETTSCNLNDLYCDRNFGEVCIKYSKFARSGEIEYFSSFCGKGIDSGWDARPITKGCHRQDNVNDAYDVSVCFCEENNCNGGKSTGALLWLIASALFLLDLQHV